MGRPDAVPGMTAKHCIITDNCRTVQGGDEGAVDEALRRTRTAMLDCIPHWPQGEGHQFHLIFTVERAQPAQTKPDDDEPIQLTGKVQVGGPDDTVAPGALDRALEDWKRNNRERHERCLAGRR